MKIRNYIKQVVEKLTYKPELGIGSTAIAMSITDYCLFGDSAIIVNAMEQDFNPIFMVAFFCGYLIYCLKK